MSKRESIARYNLIIKKLRKQPSSFSEISDYLAFESDLQEYNLMYQNAHFKGISKIFVRFIILIFNMIFRKRFIILTLTSNQK